MNQRSGQGRVFCPEEGTSWRRKAGAGGLGLQELSSMVVGVFAQREAKPKCHWRRQFPLTFLFVEMNFLFASLTSWVPFAKISVHPEEATALGTLWFYIWLCDVEVIPCEAFWACGFQRCQCLQILRLDFEHSVIQFPRLAMHVHNVFTESLYFILLNLMPLISFYYSLFSCCAWQISRGSLLRESHWKALFPNGLEMFLLLISFFMNVVSEALKSSVQPSPGIRKINFCICGDSSVVSCCCSCKPWCNSGWDLCIVFGGAAWFLS